MRGEKRNQRFRGLSWKPYPTNFGFDLTGRNAVAQLSPASEETRIAARCRADGVRDAGAPARGGPPLPVLLTEDVAHVFPEEAVSKMRLEGRVGIGLTKG